jgi:DNA-binding transcriptional regulator of glucitol operon
MNTNNNLQVVDTQQQEAAFKANEVFIRGDIGKLTNPERLHYYLTVCKSLGLNPATRPFEFLELADGRGGKKTVLYARKDCTEQLREIHGVSISRPALQFQDGLCIVAVDATDKHGRQDSDLGIVTVGNLSGDFRANAIMKAVTKAKRRVTLSICGLGMLDESELETMPDAQAVPMNLETGALEITAEADTPKAPTAAELFTQKASEFHFEYTGRQELRYLCRVLTGKEPQIAQDYRDAVALSDEKWTAAVQQANQDIADTRPQTSDNRPAVSDTLIEVAPIPVESPDKTLENMAQLK